MGTKAKRKLPDFKSEAEEAAWWFAHRQAAGKQLAEAACVGRASVLTEDVLRARLAASRARSVTIRLPEDDLALAKSQAAKKGLPYQTYIKSLLHQALHEVK